MTTCDDVRNLDITFAAARRRPARRVRLLAGRRSGVRQRRRAARTTRLRAPSARPPAAADFKGKATQHDRDFGSPERGIRRRRRRLHRHRRCRGSRSMDWVGLGGLALAQIAARKSVGRSVVVDVAGSVEPAPSSLPPGSRLGALLRSYTFSKYRIARPTSDEGAQREPAVGSIDVDHSHRRSRNGRGRVQFPAAVAEGVILARDLVNEPANVLGPVEFAERTQATCTSSASRSRCSSETTREARDGRAARRRAGQRRARRASSSCNGTAPRRKQRQARLLRRQGRRLRHRRHLDQARRRHGGHEGRHGRRGLRRRPDARARRAQGEGQRRRHHRPGREHAVGQRPAARRHRHLDVRARPSRSSTPTPRAASCSPTSLWYAQERFKPRFIIDLATLTGAIIVALGKRVRRPVLQRRRAGRRAARRPATATGEKVWRMPLGQGLRQADRQQERRHEEHRRPLRRRDHRRRSSSSASSRTRPGRISTSPARPWTRTRRRDQPELGIGLGRPPSGPTGGGWV